MFYYNLIIKHSYKEFSITSIEQNPEREFSLGRSETLNDVVSSKENQQEQLQDRYALKRVVGLSTELEDVTEVEYRQLRLEKVVLVAVNFNCTIQETENSLKELAALAQTAGSEVLDALIQKRQNPDPATYIGSGKALELKDIVQQHGADTVIVDSELAPSQRRALEDIIKIKVVDRTALILDIFAQHAKSREGKAQVELAQLEYLLPRLRGWGESMSRQAGGRVGAAGGGIGSRGPGETKIELDRRRIHRKMSKLKSEISAMVPARSAKRANRKRNSIPNVTIVGYTNAGKSSLLNILTDAEVMVENALFATLDTTVRQSRTTEGSLYTIVDTVGFVRSLPKQLVEAFRSTLEEAALADIILHVVDISHPDPALQIAAVRATLADVVSSEVPEIIVLNKADIAKSEIIDKFLLAENNAVVISTWDKTGIEDLENLISEYLPKPSLHVRVLIPYDRGELVHKIYSYAIVLEKVYDIEGTILEIKISENFFSTVSEFVI